MDTSSGLVRASLPRITIEFCTQCKWMLRAAYFAQEILSTFSLSIGEVALQPSTGGTFIVTLYTSSQGSQESQGPPEFKEPQASQPSQGPQALQDPQASQTSQGYQELTEPQAPRQPQRPQQSQAPHDPQPQAPPLATVIWDRKIHGGFPETKELKRRVRDVIDPLRDLGHVDRQHQKHQPAAQEGPGSTAQEESPAQTSPTQTAPHQGPSSAQPPAAGGAGEGCRDCA